MLKELAMCSRLGVRDDILGLRGDWGRSVQELFEVTVSKSQNIVSNPKPGAHLQHNPDKHLLNPEVIERDLADVES